MEKIVLGTCHHDCPDSCGWIATVEDGRVTKLRGNPKHPYSQGELCPKVNRFVDRVYNPDRLLSPLIRTGQKGGGQFREASWDEATALVAKNLRRVIEQHGGQAILPWWDAGTQGLIQMSSLDKRFFAKLGASQLTDSLCGATAGWGTTTTNGSAQAADPTDIAHSKMAILWATNTRLTNRHLWPYVEQARANGAKVVVIDPLRTITADSADWFIQPRPGTDVAFMLAVMHVLIRDGLVDDAYVDQYTTGYDQLVAHVQDWTPERAQAITGVAAAEIEQFATEYGTTQPAFIRTLIGGEHHESGAMFFRTLACLPLLTGSWQHLGGGLARSTGAWTEPFLDTSTFVSPALESGHERRSLGMNQLGRHLTDRSLDPAVHALFVWNGNPAVALPQANLVRQGMARDDVFMVVSEQFMTDTARYADVVFPAATQLEQRDVVASWGSMYLGWNEAAIDPVGQSVPNTELWRRLAKAMDFTEPELFESDDSLIANATKALDMDTMKRDGFLRAPIGDTVLPYAEGGFGFPDGKAQLHCPNLEHQGLPALPTWTPPVEGSGSGDLDHPLALLTPKTHTKFLNTSYSGLAAHIDRDGGPWLEITQADAVARGIAEGDQVRVFNNRAQLTLSARITNRTTVGVVAVPWGWWSQHHPDGSTANALTSDTPTDWGGGVAYSDTSVQVERFAGSSDPA